MPSAAPRELAAVFAGGMLGTAVRAAVAEALPHETGAFPWATLLVNVAGAFLLGLTLNRAPKAARPFLATGACAALTTFSALQVELLALLDRGRPALALAYAAASLAAGLVAVRMGSRA